MHPFTLLVVFLIAQLADGITTYLGLSGSREDIAEANPLARWVFDRFGLVVPIAALKLVMSALGIALVSAGGQAGLIALGILTVVGVAVVVNNLRVLRG